MKTTKRFLSVFLAVAMMLTLAPSAFAAKKPQPTPMTEDAFRTAVASGTVDMTGDVTLTNAVNIESAVTINGNGNKIIYGGTGAALNVKTSGAVEMNGVDLDATASGGCGIAVSTTQMNLTLTGCELRVNNRGINVYAEDPANPGKALDVTGSLTLDGTSILNSQISDYENNTTVGDTRGISLYRVKDSTITMQNGSSIKGFGYSINTSGDVEDRGVRPAGNIYDISNSSIWGWSATNIWTIGNEFNFTNCDLRGINPLNTLGNSFSVINISRGIYGTNPDTAAPNVFNITGGKMDAKMTIDTAMVEETLMTLEEELVTEYHFYKYVSGRNKYPVTLTCDKPFAAIVYFTVTGLDPTNALQTWIDSDKFSGAENAMYDKEFLVGTVQAGSPKIVLADAVDSLLAEGSYHAGGEGA